MRKEIGQEHIKRMARALKIVMRVFYWTSVIAVGVGVLAFVVLYFVPDKYFITTGTNPGFGLSVDGIMQFQMNPEIHTDIFLKPFYHAISVLAAVLMVGLAGIFRALRDILQTVEEAQPFAGENSQRLTIIAVIFIIGSVVYNAIQAYVASTIIHTLQLQNVNVTYSINEFLLFTGFMMLVLAGIFRYGSFLQDEYDSTL